MVYEPQEDSFLLQKYVRKLSKGRVLDMGTGSGIQAQEAAAKRDVTEVVAVDIQEDAIRQAKPHPKITFVQSDLFSSVRGKFDTIIFNPPYLPRDPQVKDTALDGGKKGYELIERFLRQASPFLSEKGCILMVFSSLTNKRKVDALIKKCSFKAELLESQHLFFENLVCYRIEHAENRAAY